MPPDEPVKPIPPIQPEPDPVRDVQQLLGSVQEELANVQRDLLEERVTRAFREELRDWNVSEAAMDSAMTLLRSEVSDVQVDADKNVTAMFQGKRRHANAITHDFVKARDFLIAKPETTSTTPTQREPEKRPPGVREGVPLYELSNQELMLLDKERRQNRTPTGPRLVAPKMPSDLSSLSNEELLKLDKQQADYETDQAARKRGASSGGHVQDDGWGRPAKDEWGRR